MEKKNRHTKRPDGHLRRGVTEEDCRWFQGSKIHDGSGNPLICFHGTQDDFEEFSYDDLDNYELGFHFGTYTQADATIRKWGEEGYWEGSNIHPVLLRITNPLVMSDPGDWTDWHEFFSALPEFENHAETLNESEEPWTPDIITAEQKQEWWELADAKENEGVDSTQALKRAIKEQGYDGCVYRNIHESGLHDNDWSFLVFEPEQIRSIF